jgi:hypothetical protein
VAADRAALKSACPFVAKKVRAIFLWQLRRDRRVQSARTTEGILIMEKKLIVTVLTMLAFGFGFALRSNAGTETIEPYRAPAPTYNYAPPPPRPAVYAPPPVAFGFAVGPGYRYWGPRFGWWGPRRFYGRRVYWRPHRHYWH